MPRDRGRGRSIHHAPGRHPAFRPRTRASTTPRDLRRRRRSGEALAADDGQHAPRRGAEPLRLLRLGARPATRRAAPPRRDQPRPGDRDDPRAKPLYRRFAGARRLRHRQRDLALRHRRPATFSQTNLNEYMHSIAVLEHVRSTQGSSASTRTSPSGEAATSARIELAHRGRALARKPQRLREQSAQLHRAPHAPRSLPRPRSAPRAVRSRRVPAAEELEARLSGLGILEVVAERAAKGRHAPERMRGRLANVRGRGLDPPFGERDARLFQQRARHQPRLARAAPRCAAAVPPARRRAGHTPRCGRCGRARGSRR